MRASGSQRPVKGHKTSAGSLCHGQKPGVGPNLGRNLCSAGFGLKDRSGPVVFGNENYPVIREKTLVNLPRLVNRQWFAMHDGSG